MTDILVITPRLLPGIKLGDGWLHVEKVEKDWDGAFGIWRQRAYTILEAPDLPEYRDDTLRSGAGGFKDNSDICEHYLTFLLAAVESLRFETDTGMKGENTELFPRPVVEWAQLHQSEIESVHLDLSE